MIDDRFRRVFGRIRGEGKKKTPAMAGVLGLRR
jgi:hypothetical protein